MKRLIAQIILLFLVQPCFADTYDKYRNIIDNYPSYTFEQREKSIAELEESNINSIEKSYILGMLYFIQSFDLMRKTAQSKTIKPELEDIIADKTVSLYLIKTEDKYNKVNEAEPGYKYIYCKYAELYWYSINEKGLERITKEVGKIQRNDRIDQCKSVLEDAAQKLASQGYSSISKTIYKTAVAHWEEYPKYMLEAIGDIENIFSNTSEANSWWSRCASETEGERSNRCESKVTMPNKAPQPTQKPRG